ncbi:MAG: peptide chain release factor N(5)-glutamine methyltransferase [Firmicutes bacterium]|nr:peptide chain release factor N(5)-glutamine methyltransferase [Bacillota bacterium]
MKNWKIGDALKWATSFLLDSGVESARVDSEILLQRILDADKGKVLSNADEVIKDNHAAVYQEMVRKRSEGVPTAYLVGTREFMSLEFVVNSNVLIPRPETEFLVEEALDFLKKKGTNSPAVLDIGTGSGAIGIALAFYYPGTRVWATDISERALEVARINAENIGVSSFLKFCQGDLFSALPGGLKFDCILSNPPYISGEELKNLDETVRDFEPEVALVAPDESISFHKRIINEAPGFMKKGALLGMEMGIGQEAQVKILLQEAGCYNNINMIKDLSGIFRVITAEFN